MRECRWHTTSSNDMLGILPAIVMLIAWLLSLYRDSHQYTPLSDFLTALSSQPEKVWMPQTDPHWDKRGSELEEIKTFSLKNM